MKPLSAVLAVLLGTGTAMAEPLISIPEDAQALCPGIRVRIYAECADQRTLMVEALVRARAEEKTLLVSFGAEWCIWCHILDAEFHGLTPGDATPEEAAIAAELAAFVAANFVIVHIDADKAEGGKDVLAATGADAHYPGGIPYVFTTDHQGRYTASLDTSAAEMKDRQDRPVHDRAVLLELMRGLVPEPKPSRTGLQVLR